MSTSWLKLISNYNEDYLPLKKLDMATDAKVDLQNDEHNNNVADQDASKVLLTDAEWKSKLLYSQYLVLRRKKTDAPLHLNLPDNAPKGVIESIKRSFLNDDNYTFHDPKCGYYACRGCNNPLYPCFAKILCQCGWPSFESCFKNNIIFTPDKDSIRTELLCKQCDGHLGHVFLNEKGMTNTNERHCINSSSIKYIDKMDDKIKKLQHGTLIIGNYSNNKNNNTNNNNTNDDEKQSSGGDSENNKPNNNNNYNQNDKIKLSEKEWKSRLTDWEYKVLREKRTDKSLLLKDKPNLGNPSVLPKGKNNYTNFFPKKGYFICKGCNNVLYPFNGKIKNIKSGWPLFNKFFDNALTTQPENDQNRFEILCKKCDGHLGHLMIDHTTKIVQKHCINSTSICYIEQKVDPEWKIVETLHKV